jgi:guanosine-3',5'-bis(diphosphate) 3'-pyrophosphohydrolase
MSTRAEKGPSLDWLNSDLGYVKTSHAQEKIRQWFKKQERGQNIERGRELLEKESRRLSLVLPNNDETARLFNFDSFDDFLAALGYGGITVHQLAQKLTFEPEPPSQITRVLTTHKINTMGVQVMGVGDLLTRLAPCCHPLPGDAITGFITRAKGISIHRKDCTNIVNLKETERLVDVQWGKVQEFYPVDIEIDVWDRVGLLRDLTALVAEEKVNIDGLTTQEHADKVTIFATLDVKDMSQLNQLLSRIRSIHGVIGANRASHDNVKIDQAKAIIN